MSTLVVLDVIVKGLNVVAALGSAGKSLTDIVTWLLPVNTLKFGRNLPIAKNTSLWSFCNEKLKDWTKEVKAVVLPSGLIWSVPTSCSNKTVWPKPVSPWITGNVPVLELLNAVAYGFGYTYESIQVVLIEFVFVAVYQLPIGKLALSCP